MWPEISINIGTFQGQIHLYSLMIGCGLCHLFLGVDISARARKMEPVLIGNFHYSLCAAFLDGLLIDFMAKPLMTGQRSRRLATIRRHQTEMKSSVFFLKSI